MLMSALKFGLQGCAAIIGFSILLNRKLFFNICKTLPRDIRALKRGLTILFLLWFASVRNLTAIKLFEYNAKKYPNKICLYFEEQKWTFKQVQEMSNKIGNYFQQLGFKKGDTVALFMENKPEYVCIWLGLAKVGVVTALINFNLRNHPLLHTLKTANCKAIIYGDELTEALQELLQMEEMYEIEIFSHGHKDKPRITGAKDLNEGLVDASIKLPVPETPIQHLDNLYLIYTSGTTGLPKAAVIRHLRFLMAGYGLHYMQKIGPEDILYSPLPLYHSAAGMLSISQVLLFGTSMVLKKKFSATNFWKDCKKYNVTVFQYIGEICRYLYTQPPSAHDKDHNVRLMIGNGLRAEIWKDFIDRFNIPNVGEYYGSTEGNCNIVNIDSHIGAVGFIPRFIYPLLSMKLIKVEESTGEPMRDPKSQFCILCKPNEIGELIGKKHFTHIDNTLILYGKIDTDHPLRDFKGYADKEATKKKIINDVFKKGDKYFRTGDVLVFDDCGYFYFRDRFGDTFRWKGENVSTAEVESVVSKVCGLKTCACYGVQIPNVEGRAGMVCIRDEDNSLDLEELAKGIIKSLPAYARPLFLRVSKEIDMTETFKLKKFDLQKEGFDIHMISKRVNDKLYFFNGTSFTKIDEEFYNKLIKGEVRL